MPRIIVAFLAAGLLLAGCAADSSLVDRALVMQSGFDPLPCPEVVAKYKWAEGRVKELTALMEKSGSPIANALAYDTEYATARATKRYAQQAAQKKGCELAGAPAPIEPPPPAAVQVDVKK